MGNDREIPPLQQILFAINNVRRYILGLMAAVFATSFLFYLKAPLILFFFQNHLDQKLAFFAVAEPFLAHVKLGLISAIFTLMPLIAGFFWLGLAKPFNISKAAVSWFIVATCLLFYAGTLFCYSITLPFGVKFLLEFQSAELQPIISIGKFVNFVALFILAFGLIFELPIFMVFTARAGLISRRSFQKNRRYAVLVISIVAALLTPTPDIVNMLLMGLPLYLLYEMGILILKLLKI